MFRTSSARLSSHIRTALSGINNTNNNIIAPATITTTTQHQPPSDLDKFSFHTPSEGVIRKSIYETVTIPQETIDQYVWRDIHKWRNKVAAVCGATGRQYTFAELHDATMTFAIHIQNKFKLKPRQVAAVVLPNLPEYPIAIFGLLQAGVVATTVNSVYSAEEIGRQLEDSDAKLVIGTVACYQNLKKACDLAKRKIPIVCIKTEKDESIPDGAVDFFQLIDAKQVNFSDLKVTDVKMNDLAILPYSSGTTGLPKGVCLNHTNIVSNCEMLEKNSPFESIMQDTTDTCQDVSPSILPFFHIYGFTVCMLSKLKLGVKLVTIPKFTPDAFRKSIVDHEATILQLVPPMVLFMTNCQELNARNLEKLRVIFSGAAPIGLLDIDKFRTKFPHMEFIQGYGLTETSPVVFMGHIGSKKYDSVGFPAANTEAKIVSYDDPKCLGLGPNQTGEIWMRGPQVMQGYLNNDQATNEMLVSGNWLRTGDIGHYDQDGYFFITDRMKELIKVKGFQVPPAELEAILRDHPKILDAGVIGVPHLQYGEAPCAFIVLRDQQYASVDEIQDFVASKVAPYKKLNGGVQFVKEIPKTASGKILRKELKLNFS